MMHNKLFLLIFISLVPTLVFANAGSPMMWFGILHLLIINAIIGIYESNYLAKHRIPNRTWLIVLGNYFSMFIGMLFIAPVFASASGNYDFWGGNTSYGNYEIGGFIMGMLFSYLATLLIEYPFFYYAVKQKEDQKKGFNQYVTANTITNGIMFVVYFLIVIGGSK